MKILIVDDDFAARRLIQAYLSELGSCTIATNGKEALEAVSTAIQENEPYDLICLDIMMPEIDGIEALGRIREIEAENDIHGLSGVKIIMTTAKDQSKDIFASFREGCEAYIIKPVFKETIIEQIEKLGLIEESQG